MDTVESDKIINQYLENQEKARQLEMFKLRKNLETFTAKELKREIIAMKADKLAVTKMNREQLINLIISFHWLFPHLINKKGTKRDPTAVSARRRRPLTRPPKQAQPTTSTAVPPMSIKLTPKLLAMINKPDDNEGSYLLMLISTITFAKIPNNRLKSATFQ